MAEQDPTMTNVRITNAVLGEKLDGLKEDMTIVLLALNGTVAQPGLISLAKKNSDARADHEKRIRLIEGYKWLWKGMLWVAGIVGLSVIGLLWSILTHQVVIQVVEAAGTGVK